MRRMGRARRVVLQPGFVGRDRAKHADALDGAVGQVLVKVVVLGVMGGFDRFDVLDERRRPLVGIAADEAVEVLEPESGRPQVVRTGLTAVPIGNVVILAVPRGVPAVLLEHLGKRAGAFRHERVVAREAAAELHDDAGSCRMVIAPGEQRRPCGRAERRGVELRVAQPRLRQPVHGRRRDRSAERAGCAKAHVVSEDEQDVRRAFRGGHLLGKVLDGVFGLAADEPAEGLFRSGQDFLSNRPSLYGNEGEQCKT